MTRTYLIIASITAMFLLTACGGGGGISPLKITPNGTGGVDITAQSLGDTAGQSHDKSVGESPIPSVARVSESVGKSRRSGFYRRFVLYAAPAQSGRYGTFLSEGGASGLAGSSPTDAYTAWLNSVNAVEVFDAPTDGATLGKFEGDNIPPEVSGTEFDDKYLVWLDFDRFSTSVSSGTHRGAPSGDFAGVALLGSASGSTPQFIGGITPGTDVGTPITGQSGIARWDSLLRVILGAASFDGTLDEQVLQERFTLCVDLGNQRFASAGQYNKCATAASATTAQNIAARDSNFNDAVSGNDFNLKFTGGWNAQGIIDRGRVSTGGVQDITAILTGLVGANGAAAVFASANADSPTAADTHYVGGFISQASAANAVDTVNHADWLATGRGVDTLSDVRVHQFLNNASASGAAVGGRSSLTFANARYDNALLDASGDSDDGFAFFVNATTRERFAGIFTTTDLGAPLTSNGRNGTWNGSVYLNYGDNLITRDLQLAVAFGAGDSAGTVESFTNLGVSGSPLRHLLIEGSFNSSGVMSGKSTLADFTDSNKATPVIPSAGTPIAEFTYSQGALGGLIGAQGAVGIFRAGGVSSVDNLNYAGGFVAAAPANTADCDTAPFDVGLGCSNDQKRVACGTDGTTYTRGGTPALCNALIADICGGAVGASAGGAGLFTDAYCTTGTAYDGDRTRLCLAGGTDAHASCAEDARALAICDAQTGEGQHPGCPDLIEKFCVAGGGNEGQLPCLANGARGWADLRVPLAGTAGYHRGEGTATIVGGAAALELGDGVAMPSRAETLTLNDVDEQTRDAATGFALARTVATNPDNSSETRNQWYIGLLRGTDVGAPIAQRGGTSAQWHGKIQVLHGETLLAEPLDFTLNIAFPGGSSALVDEQIDITGAVLIRDGDETSGDDWLTLRARIRLLGRGDTGVIAGGGVGIRRYADGENAQSGDPVVVGGVAQTSTGVLSGAAGKKAIVGVFRSTRNNYGDFVGGFVVAPPPAVDCVATPIDPRCEIQDVLAHCNTIERLAMTGDNTCGGFIAANPDSCLANLFSSSLATACAGNESDAATTRDTLILACSGSTDIACLPMADYCDINPNATGCTGVVASFCASGANPEQLPCLALPDRVKGWVRLGVPLAGTADYDRGAGSATILAGATEHELGDGVAMPSINAALTLNDLDDVSRDATTGFALARTTATNPNPPNDTIDQWYVGPLSGAEVGAPITGERGAIAQWHGKIQVLHRDVLIDPLDFTLNITFSLAPDAVGHYINGAVLLRDGDANTGDDWLQVSNHINTFGDNAGLITGLGVNISRYADGENFVRGDSVFEVGGVAQTSTGILSGLTGDNAIIGLFRSYENTYGDFVGGFIVSPEVAAPPSLPVVDTTPNAVAYNDWNDSFYPALSPVPRSTGNAFIAFTGRTFTDTTLAPPTAFGIVQQTRRGYPNDGYAHYAHSALNGVQQHFTGIFPTTNLGEPIRKTLSGVSWDGTMTLSRGGGNLRHANGRFDARAMSLLINFDEDAGSGTVSTFPTLFDDSTYRMWVRGTFDSTGLIRGTTIMADFTGDDHATAVPTVNTENYSEGTLRGLIGEQGVVAVFRANEVHSTWDRNYSGGFLANSPEFSLPSTGFKTWDDAVSPSFHARAATASFAQPDPFTNLITQIRGDSENPSETTRNIVHQSINIKNLDDSFTRQNALTGITMHGATLAQEVGGAGQSYVAAGLMQGLHLGALAAPLIAGDVTTVVPWDSRIAGIFAYGDTSITPRRGKFNLCINLGAKKFASQTATGDCDMPAHAAPDSLATAGVAFESGDISLRLRGGWDDAGLITGGEVRYDDTGENIYFGNSAIESTEPDQNAPAARLTGLVGEDGVLGVFIGHAATTAAGFPVGIAGGFVARAPVIVPSCTNAPFLDSLRCSDQHKKAACGEDGRTYSTGLGGTKPRCDALIVRICGGEVGESTGGNGLFIDMDYCGTAYDGDRNRLCLADGRRAHDNCKNNGALIAACPVDNPFVGDGTTTRCDDVQGIDAGVRTTYCSTDHASAKPFDPNCMDGVHGEVNMARADICINDSANTHNPFNAGCIPPNFTQKMIDMAQLAACLDGNQNPACGDQDMGIIAGYCRTEAGDTNSTYCPRAAARATKLATDKAAIMANPTGTKGHARWSLLAIAPNSTGGEGKGLDIVETANLTVATHSGTEPKDYAHYVAVGSAGLINDISTNPAVNVDLGSIPGANSVDTNAGGIQTTKLSDLTDGFNDPRLTNAEREASGFSAASGRFNDNSDNNFAWAGILSGTTDLGGVITRGTDSEDEATATWPGILGVWGQKSDFTLTVDYGAKTIKNMAQRYGDLFGLAVLIDAKYTDLGIIYGTSKVGSNVAGVNSGTQNSEGTITGLIGNRGAVAAFISDVRVGGGIGHFSGGFVARPNVRITLPPNCTTTPFDATAIENDPNNCAPQQRMACADTPTVNGTCATVANTYCDDAAGGYTINRLFEDICKINMANFDNHDQPRIDACLNLDSGLSDDIRYDCDEEGGPLELACDGNGGAVAANPFAQKTMSGQDPITVCIGPSLVKDKSYTDLRVEQCAANLVTAGTYTNATDTLCKAEAVALCVEDSNLFTETLCHNEYDLDYSAARALITGGARWRLAAVGANVANDGAITAGEPLEIVAAGALSVAAHSGGSNTTRAAHYIEVGSAGLIDGNSANRALNVGLFDANGTSAVSAKVGTLKLSELSDVDSRLPIEQQEASGLSAAVGSFNTSSNNAFAYAGILSGTTGLGGAITAVENYEEDATGTWSGQIGLVSAASDFKKEAFTMTVNYGAKTITSAAKLYTGIAAQLTAKYNDFGIIYGTSKIGTTVSAVNTDHIRASSEGTVTGLIGNYGAVGVFVPNVRVGNIRAPFAGGFVARPDVAIITPPVTDKEGDITYRTWTAEIHPTLPATPIDPATGRLATFGLTRANNQVVQHTDTVSTTVYQRVLPFSAAATSFASDADVLVAPSSGRISGVSLLSAGIPATPEDGTRTHRRYYIAGLTNGTNVGAPILDNSTPLSSASARWNGRLAVFSSEAERTNAPFPQDAFKGAIFQVDFGFCVDFMKSQFFFQRNNQTSCTASGGKQIRTADGTTLPRVQLKPSSGNDHGRGQWDQTTGVMSMVNGHSFTFHNGENSASGTLTGIIGQNGAVGAFSGNGDIYFVGGFVAAPPR